MKCKNQSVLFAKHQVIGWFDVNKLLSSSAHSSCYCLLKSTKRHQLERMVSCRANPLNRILSFAHNKRLDQDLDHISLHPYRRTSLWREQGG